MPQHDSQLTPPVSDRDHVAGPDTAAITLVSYCDFECPYCGRAYPIIKDLQGRLADRLQYVFRHFPLSEIHPFAQQAAEAAETAAAQGQFWPMYDVLFENQAALAEEDLCGYAASLGLDVARFKEELNGRIHATRVSRDILSGQRSGVTGTPTFYINGLLHTDEANLAGLVLRLAA